MFASLLDDQEQEIIELFISAITVIELLSGEMPKAQETLTLQLVSDLEIIPVHRELAAFAGNSKRGKKLFTDLADYLIGISSVYVGAKLATRNIKHFVGIKGLEFYPLKT